MIEHIKAVKRGLRDQHGFRPKPNSDTNDPSFDTVPDGTYPMEINGQIDNVRITNGEIYCLNF